LKEPAAHFKVINTGLPGGKNNHDPREERVTGFSFLEMVSPFLGQLLVMLAQHEHYEMRGMQWPKCVKHVHKVTIKPI